MVYQALQLFSVNQTTKPTTKILPASQNRLHPTSSIATMLSPKAFTSTSRARLLRHLPSMIANGADGQIRLPTNRSMLCYMCTCLYLELLSSQLFPKLRLTTGTSSKVRRQSCSFRFRMRSSRVCYRSSSSVATDPRPRLLHWNLRRTHSA
jgi:hypothetical protein